MISRFTAKVNYRCSLFHSVPSHSPEELQSSHSRAIRDIIGTSTELTEYDQLLVSLKRDRPFTQPEKRNMHDRVLASLQTRVIAAFNSLSSQRKEREKTSLEVSGNLPISLEHKECLRKLKRCKALLRVWNITL